MAKKKTAKKATAKKPGYELKLGNHPAQADHPTQPGKLIKDGVPVPLLPDHRAVFLDGRCICYVSPTGHMAFIVDQKKLGSIADEAVELVAKEFKPDGSVAFLKGIAAPKDDTSD